MAITLNRNRIFSSLLASVYVVGGFVVGGGEGGFKVIGFVILPLACIWFSEAMGGYTGPSGSIWISAPSPGLIVCILGWLLLLMPLIIIAISYVAA